MKNVVHKRAGHDPRCDRDREDSYQREGSSGTRYSPGPLRIALRGQFDRILACRPGPAGAELKNQRRLGGPGPPGPYTAAVAIGIDASRAFSQAPTGIGVYSTEICAGLAAAPPFPLVLYYNGRHRPALAPPLVPGTSWRLIPLPRGWTAIRLRLELSAHPPELLFVPAYRLPGGRLPRSVVTIHGVEHRMAPTAYPGRAGAEVESFIKETLMRAARVISPSETTRSDLVHLYGADPTRITVIPHGTAAHLRPRSQEEEEEAAAALSISAPYLLAVGAHHPRKNIPFLIRTFAKAFPSGSERPWLVVTNAAGEVATTLAGIARQAGAGERVRLLPHVGGEQLAALYSGALAACVPSLYEGFGLPALEAMACGTPVIGSDVGGVREVASGAALLVELGSESEWMEGISRLATDAQLRAHLSQLGLARAAKFSWADSVSAHAALLAAELALARSGQRR